MNNVNPFSKNIFELTDLLNNFKIPFMGEHRTDGKVSIVISCKHELPNVEKEDGSFVRFIFYDGRFIEMEII